MHLEIFQFIVVQHGMAVYMICSFHHEVTYLSSLELSWIEGYIGECDSFILLIYKCCFFIFLLYVMLYPNFLSVLCSVYVVVLNYFMCSVLAYVKPFIDWFTRLRNFLFMERLVSLDSVIKLQDMILFCLSCSPLNKVNSWVTFFSCHILLM